MNQSNTIVEQALGKAIRQTEANVEPFRKCYKFSYSTHHVYIPVPEPFGWTDGFWPGELNLAYQATGNKKFLDAAGEYIPLFFDRIVDKIQVDHHDMGFLYSPSCVAYYEETKDRMARRAALLAADNLLLRYHEIGRFLQCWGTIGARDNYRFIIDSMLNVPLLFWAWKETGWDNYRRIAVIHLETVFKTVFRKDGSTFQSYFLDPDTGKPDHGETHQGYKNDSAWARGQAWGVYGSALAYRNTNWPKAKETFFKSLAFFESKLPSDHIPYWDLTFSTGSTEPRDASALAIVICGLLEMEHTMQEEAPTEAEVLHKKALDYLTTLCVSCAANEGNGLLFHSTYARKSPYNTCTEKGVDECCAWGDYYYMEALVRMKNPDWVSFW